jgi:serine/threonine protein kinase
MTAKEKEKEKAVAGLVLGLQFGHSLGPLHEHLTKDNVLLNDDGVIQITDSHGNRLAGQDWDDDENDDADWTLMGDIRAFADIVSVIAVGA